MNDWFDAEQHVERAHELYESGRWEDALRELKAALKVNPYQGEWHYNMGLTLDAMGRFDEAITCYRAALEYQGDEVEILNSLGVDLLRVERASEALAAFEQAERLDSAHEASYVHRIAAYAELGDHEQAETMFYLALQIADDSPKAYLNLSQSLLDRGDHARAIWCLENALRLDPEDDSVQARLGLAHQLAGHHDEAYKWYLRQMRQFPGDLETLLDLGELLVEMNRPVEAAEKFRRVAELEPSHAEAHFRLAELGFRAGHLDAARVAFELSLQFNPRRPETRARLAAICLRRGERDEAVNYLRDELAIVDVADDPAAGETFGQVLLEAGMYAEAGRIFRQLLTLHPEDARLTHELAVALLLNKQIDAGIRVCRDVLRIDGDYRLAMYNLALAGLEKGQLTQARYWARRALRLSPEDKRVRRIASRIRLAIWRRRLRRLIGRA